MNCNMLRSMICNILILSSVVWVTSSFSCRLFGIDQATSDTKFIEFYNGSSHRNMLNLPGTFFSSSAATTRLNNHTYVSTYNTYDAKGIPYFFLLMIDVETKSIKLNRSLTDKEDNGGFYHIGVADNDSNIYGIRDSFDSAFALEVARINPVTGEMATIGIYPVGTFSIVMTFASKRRVYYNVIESTLYGISIDTGELVVHSSIPPDYIIYGLDYDSAKDRLIGMVFPGGSNDGVWYLAELVLKAKDKLDINRIGNSEVPFETYFWSTTYAMDERKRLWITLWGTQDNRKDYFFVFNIDHGTIVEQGPTSLTYFNNLACLS